MCLNYLKLFNYSYLRAFAKKKKKRKLATATASFVMFFPPVRPHGMTRLPLGVSA
jgi:hypothetical protein